MKPLAYALGGAVALLAAGAVMLLQPVHPGAAESTPPTAPMMDHSQMMDHAMHGMAGNAAVPTLPGQDAFGAMQEIVRMLEADPKTDWSKVNLAALREHLVDMNAVTLEAAVTEKPVDGGIAATVTGSGRTLAAIQRMLPAHAHELSQLNGWTATTAPLADGVLFTVTAKDAAEVQHIRGLGFFGLLVSGSHHQPHHLAMAKGSFALGQQ